jgi:hypothetical protein
MPLSEHEQRLLEQMERALYAEDPKFATSLRSASSRAARGKAVFGILAVFLGLGIVVVGVALPMAVVGVIGFAVMLVGAIAAYGAFTSPSAPTSEEAAAAPGQPRSAKANSGFMEKMEERWRKRNEGQM